MVTTSDIVLLISSDWNRANVSCFITTVIFLRYVSFVSCNSIFGTHGHAHCSHPAINTCPAILSS